MVRSLTIALAFLAAGALVAANDALAMGEKDGSPASASSSGQDYAMAKKASDAGDYQKAIDLLKKVVRADRRNADAYNLLAYSHRKSGQLTEAAVNYRRALRINANHQGALEYQGELFIMQGNLQAARENLGKLVKLCPSGCEARSELETALAKAQDKSS